MRLPLTRLAGAGMLLAMAALAAVGTFGAAGLQHTVTESGIPCLFRGATGVRCPFCGLTHAVVALGAGDLTAAVTFHPLAPVIVAVTAWGALALARGRRLSAPDRRTLPAILAATAAVWAANILAH